LGFGVPAYGYQLEAGNSYGASRADASARARHFAPSAGMLQAGDMSADSVAAMHFAVSCGGQALARFTATCLPWLSGVTFGASNEVRAHADV
jgi:hypothetical protein